jgi:hypothetical protein
MKKNKKTDRANTPKKTIIIRNMPDFHSLFCENMPVFGKDHNNKRCRMLQGLSGFMSTSGHFLDRLWGQTGSALCGETIHLDKDPVILQKPLPRVAKMLHQPLPQNKTRARPKTETEPYANSAKIGDNNAMPEEKETASLSFVCPLCDVKLDPDQQLPDMQGRLQ